MKGVISEAMDFNQLQQAAYNLQQRQLHDCTSDICVAVLPLAPSITIARAEEMLNGEKKMFPVLSLLLSSLSKVREKALFALDRGVADAIVSGIKKRGQRC